MVKLKELEKIKSYQKENPYCPVKIIPVWGNYSWSYSSYLICYGHVDKMKFHQAHVDYLEKYSTTIPYLITSRQRREYWINSRAEYIYADIQNGDDIFRNRVYKFSAINCGLSYVPITILNWVVHWKEEAPLR